MNKTLCRICLLVLFVNLKVYSQNTWFRIHDLLPGNSDYEQPLVMDSKGEDFYILIKGLGSNIPYTRNTLVKLNKDGDIIWERFMEYPQVSLYFFLEYYPRMLLVSSDTSIYALSYAQNIELRYEALLNKFNSDGDLLWVKTYGFPDVDIEGGTMGLALTSDSLGVILTGRTISPSEQQYVIMRIDSSGNLLWKQLLPVLPNRVGGHVPVVQMPDKSIATAFDDNFVTDLHDYLMSLDSVGNIQNTIANPLTGEAIDLKLHTSGNLVYLSRAEVSTGNMGGLRVQMLTPAFDVLWSRLYNDTQFPYLFLGSAFVRNLSIAPDGKILALGYNTTNCVLLCYNSAGTMLWKRDVVLEGFDLLKFNYAIWTSDGGILLNGWIYGDNGYPSFSQIFFLKLDQYGCILPDCAETIITSVENMDATTSTFAVSPNPTGGQINITYKGQDTRSVVDCKVAIYDNFGRPVLDGGFLSGESTVFDLKGWEAGVYHLSISNREGRCYYERIIKD